MIQAIKDWWYDLWSQPYIITHDGHLYGPVYEKEVKGLMDAKAFCNDWVYHHPYGRAYARKKK